MIFIDQAKCWAIAHIHRAKLFYKSFDKCCFASAHFSVEAQSFTGNVLQDFLGDFINLAELKGYFQGILFCLQNYKRNDHFLQRNPTMLIGIAVIAYIMVIVIGVSEEKVILGKNKTAAQVYIGQVDVLGILARQHILILIG